jgi:hypothetical protein
LLPWQRICLRQITGWREKFGCQGNLFLTPEARMRFRDPTLILILLALVCLASCSEEDNEFSAADPEVVVRLAPGRDPLPGIKVVPMDPATNLPGASPRMSDEGGVCVFPDLPEGRYNLVAYGGSEYFVVSNAEELSGQAKSAPFGGMDLPGVPEKTSPPPPPVEILMALRQVPGGLPRFSGQVVDGITGQPLEAAFVSTSPFLSGYAGRTTYQDDVTLPDGRFSVSEIMVAPNPDTGNLIQIEPLLVTCAGYRPLSWTHHFANGDQNLDVSGVTIQLQPVQSGDTGELSGRLLLEGEPVAGVVVGLGGSAATKSGVGQPGFTAMTDDAGVFHFTGLPGGVYFLHPAFRPLDGFTFPNQQGNFGRQVVPGQETLAGDLTLLHEIRLLYPPNGWDYFGAQWLEDFQWSAVPGATRYVAFLDRGVLGETDTTSIAIPEDWILNPGLHSWSVLAYSEGIGPIGAAEVTGIFFIVEPPTR